MKTKAKRRHRLSALVAVLCIVAILAPFAGLTAFAQTSGDFEYRVLSETDKTCEITDYTGSATNLTIPSKLNGYTVTSIGVYAFEYCYNLTEVTIPQSVTSIGNEAFRNCDSLTQVTIPEGVTSIGNEAFRNCSSLTQVTIPQSVTSIGYAAFSECYDLTEVTIPNSVTSIGDEAFSECHNLTEMTIPNSVTSIGFRAFTYCTSLTQVTIPDSVTSIGEGAFSSCFSLTQVLIPDSVTSIGKSAFRECFSLTEVTIPGSVTSIGDFAFDICTSLTKIDVDSQNPAYSSKDGVLFNKAQTKLIQYPNGKTDTSYTIPQGVTSIGVDAFSSCSSLTQVNIPDSVTSIGDEAFFYCKSLTQVTIPEGVTSIGEGAFGYCGLTQVTIPGSVTSIGDFAFVDCYSLPEIDVDSQNPAYSSKDGVLFNKAQTELIQYPIGKTDTSYTIPQGVTSIGDYAFEGCQSLMEVTIPDSVTSIGEYAFATCDSLTTVTIPDGVTSIGYSAFAYCHNLTAVTIPQSVTSIENDAFYGCENLTIYGYSGSYAESYAKENGFAFIVLAELHDAKSGITVAADDVNVFPENAELAVSVVDTANDRITYDISLQADGKKIRPNGSVTVKIPVPETMDGANVKVYRQETDGTLTDMHATFQDGYAVFTTDHFSRYILESKTESVQPTDPAKPTDPTQSTNPANPQLGQSGTTQAPANNAHTDIPKTGSASNALAGTCAFMLAIAAVGALGLKKAYRKKQA